MLGMMRHVCNPSYAVGIGSVIMVQGWASQKCETLSKNKMDNQKYLKE
jgi:hypothetical protein